MSTFKKIAGISNEASQRFRTVINKKTYIIEIYYRDISISWYANLRAADNTPMAMGRRLSTNWPVFPNLIEGAEKGIAPASLIEPAEELGRFPWGITHNLVYRDDSE